MAKADQTFQDYHTLKMTPDDAYGATVLHDAFHAATANIPGLRFGIEKAAVLIGPEETAEGLSHPFADGRPFYRMTVDARGSVAQMNDAVKTVFGLMESYTRHAVTNIVCDDHVVLTMDVRTNPTEEAQRLEQVAASVVRGFKPV